MDIQELTTLLDEKIQLEKEYKFMLPSQKWFADKRIEAINNIINKLTIKEVE